VQALSVRSLNTGGVVEFFNRPGWWETTRGGHGPLLLTRIEASGSPMFFKEVKDEIDKDYCANYLQ
jgi:hypothetical protein